MSAPTIRHADQRDLAALVRIYNHYVASTHVTFDTQAVTEEERQTWLARFSDRGPHQLLVAEVEARVVGYASSLPHRPKRGYDRSVETTIYLDAGLVGRGLGTLLYGDLLERLQSEPSVHRAFGGIALPNAGSIALHEKLGFTLIGTFHEIGYKFGRYIDVSWYEKDVSGTA